MKGMDIVTRVPGRRPRPISMLTALFAILGMAALVAPHAALKAAPPATAPVAHRVITINPAPQAADWSRDDAAHLLRRAGFGGTPEQIDRLHALGKTAAVDYLLGSN